MENSGVLRINRMSIHKCKEIHELQNTLHNLSEDLSRLVITEQRALGGDLARMSNLLKEAAHNLRDCFSAMSNQLTEQSAQLRRRQSRSVDGNPANKDIESLLSSTNEISSHVATAVRALQFEDILQQMIGHSRKRISQIENVFTLVQKQIEGLKDIKQEDKDRILSVLRTCQDEIAEVQQVLNVTSPVKQESLKSGDVELF